MAVFWFINLRHCSAFLSWGAHSAGIGTLPSVSGAQLSSWSLPDYLGDLLWFLCLRTLFLVLLLCIEVMNLLVTSQERVWEKIGGVNDELFFLFVFRTIFWFKKFIFVVTVYVCEHAHARACMLRTEGSFVEPVLSFHFYADSEDWSQVARLVQWALLSSESSCQP